MIAHEEWSLVMFCELISPCDTGINMGALYSTVSGLLNFYQQSIPWFLSPEPQPWQQCI